MPSRAPYLSAVVVAVAFVYALGFHDKGLVMGEEGQILTEAEGILSGKVLYRDIDGYVAPGVWYLTALVLAVGGHTVNATRVAMAALFALQVGVVFALTERAASRRAAFAAAGGLLLLKVLAFPLGVFIWYTDFAVFFGLVAVWALFLHEQEGAPRWLVFAGAAAALSVVFKQNIGGYVWIALTAFLLVHHRTRRALALFQAPVAVIGLATLAYFGAAGALPELLRGLLYVPFAGFYETGRMSYLTAFKPGPLDPMEAYHYLPVLFWEERFLHPGSGAVLAPVARAIGIGMYAAPIAVTAVALLRLRRRRPLEREALLLLLGAGAIFLGSFPRADFVHVAQTLVGFVPLAAWLAARAAWRRALWIGLAPAAAVVAAFCVAVVWQLPYDHRLDLPKARVWVSEPFFRSVTETLTWLEEEVPPDAPVAFVPASPMYHFLTDRPVPHRYTVMMQPNIGFDGGADVARALQESGVRYVVYGQLELPGLIPFEDYAPALLDYLEANFSPVESRRFRHWETVKLLKRHAAP